MEWLNTILQGILLGGLYAMFAAGLSLIFGVMRLVNIAHGDLIVLAAYVALVAAEALGIDPLASLVIVVPVMAVIGYALQRGAAQPHARRRSPAAAAGHLRPLGHHPERTARTVSPPTASSSTPARSRSRASPSAAGSPIGVLPLIQFALAVAVIAGLQWLFYRTALGRAFRATSDDPPVAQLMGMDNAHVFAPGDGAVARHRRRRRRAARQCAPTSIPRSVRRG